MADEMLQHMLADFHARGGLQLSLRWLYTLFAAHARIPAAAAAAAGPPALCGPEQGAAAEQAVEAAGRQASGAAAGLSGRHGAGGGLEGTQYEAVLLALLEGLRCARLRPAHA